MACGVPVVATNAPYGLNEMIVSGDNGFLVNVGDFNGIAVNIIKLLNNCELRKRFIFKAKKRVREEFSFDHMCKKYEKLFFSY